VLDPGGRIGAEDPRQERIPSGVSSPVGRVCSGGFSEGGSVPSRDTVARGSGPSGARFVAPEHGGQGAEESIGQRGGGCHANRSVHSFVAGRVMEPKPPSPCSQWTGPGQNRIAFLAKKGGIGVCHSRGSGVWIVLGPM